MYLRNIAIDILNANALGALTLIRPFSELSIFFLYFRCLSEKKGLNKLYGWMNGDNGKPPFADALKFVISEQKEKYNVLANIIDTQEEIIAQYYKALSAYNHTPRVHESIGQMAGGFGPSHLQDVFYAMISVSKIIQSLCILFSIVKHMILFPKNEFQKFGFNGPVGVFSDTTNFSIFTRCFPDDLIKELLSVLGTSEEVEGICNFYDSQKQLDEDEIRSSYKAHESEDTQKLEESSIDELIARHKAKFRTLSWFMNYVSQKDANAAI